MAILDARNKFCEKLDVFANAATTLRGDVMQLDPARDIGEGQPLFLNIVVTTAFSGGTSQEFHLRSDAQAAIAVDGSATLHATTGAVPVAELVAGKGFSIPLPNEGRAYEEFIGLLVTGVGNATVGAITAFLSGHAIAGWQAYPANT